MSKPLEIKVPLWSGWEVTKANIYASGSAVLTLAREKSVLELEAKLDSKTKSIQFPEELGVVSPELNQIATKQVLKAISKEISKSKQRILLHTHDFIEAHILQMAEAPWDQAQQIERLLRISLVKNYEMFGLLVYNGTKHLSVKIIAARIYGEMFDPTEGHKFTRKRERIFQRLLIHPEKSIRDAVAEGFRFKKTEVLN